MGQAWLDLSVLHRKVLAIYAANAFGGGGGAGVFLLGSCINNSCLPNINFTYNIVLKEETLHAIRDITEGSELTIMYIDGTNRTRDQRQAQLDERGIRCVCLACENTPQGRKREEKRL